MQKYEKNTGGARIDKLRGNMIYCHRKGVRGFHYIYSNAFYLTLTAFVHQTDMKLDCFGNYIIDTYLNFVHLYTELSQQPVCLQLISLRYLHPLCIIYVTFWHAILKFAQSSCGFHFVCDQDWQRLHTWPSIWNGWDSLAFICIVPQRYPVLFLFLMGSHSFKYAVTDAII